MIAIKNSDRYSNIAVMFGVVALLTAMGLGGLTKVYYDQTTARFERSTDKLLELQTEITRLLLLVPAGIYTDSTFSIFNDPDFLRLFCFDADQLTAQQKRTYTAPDANGSLALVDDIPTMFATITPTYLTLTTDPGLVNERVLLMSNTTFDVVDLGPGSAFQVDLKDTGVVPGEYTRATLTVNDKGLVTNATSNISGNLTCPSEFPDNTFLIVNDVVTTAAVQFNVTDLTPSLLRTMTVQADSGVIAYLTDVGSVFPDDTFTVQNAAVPSKRVQFNCFDISPGFTRIMTIQDSSGVIAYLSDIATTFADNVFVIFDQVDGSKQATFNAAGISPNTNRTYAFPNLSGDLLLTVGAQSLTNKIIQGPTNLVDADLLRTSAAGVNVAAAAPPSPGQILVTSVSTTAAIWQSVPFSFGNWTPVFTSGLSGTPFTPYANYQRMQNLVFCTLQVDGYTPIGTGFLTFQFTLPLPRSGNFPASPILAVGLGQSVPVDGSGSRYSGSIVPISGQQRVEYRGRKPVGGLTVFYIEFMYEL